MQWRNFGKWLTLKDENATYAVLDVSQWQTWLNPPA
jgi:hypothetical protein